MVKSDFPMSIDVEYSVQYRNSVGKWIASGNKVNTRTSKATKRSFLGLFSFNTYETSEHDDFGARTQIETIAKKIKKDNKTDTRIICEFWDSAGWGEGSTNIVWQNGKWLD